MGYSNGGGFTYDLACRLNDKITGIGAVARTMYAESMTSCVVTHPTPVVTILGTNDFISNYDGVEYQGTCTTTAATTSTPTGWRSTDSTCT